MRRLVMWNLQTLDGFFEGSKPWDLGGGTPLFKLHDHSRRLKLVASRTLATGGMILTYHPFPATAAGTPNEPAGA
ncbi:MAG: hypothetical protein U0132_23490 [Gemmatimonadaceae bacterium]